MELVVLGSGSAFAAGTRAQAGYLVRHGGTSLLVDAGPGTLANLVRHGVQPETLDAIFLTHWHPDHVSDLVPVLFQMKHAKVSRTSDVPVHGPDGFTVVSDALMSVFGAWCVGELYDVVPIEVERDVISLGAIEVRAFPVRHGVPAVGYRLSAAGHVVAITGDTGPTDELVELARGADVLVADATLPEGDDYDAHMSASQAAAVAASAGVRTLVLSHLSPEVDGESALRAARAAFDGQIALAQDLMAVAL